MLSVRIRPDLHARLKKAAQWRGVSVTSVVESLIEENLLEDVTMQMKFDSLQAMVGAQKSQLKALEIQVMVATEPGKGKGAASVLTGLRAMILRNREARGRLEKEIEARREARAQRLALPPPRKHRTSPFDGLGTADTERVAPSQLPLPERRRLRLCKVLGQSPKGTRTRLARALGVSASYFSQMLLSPSNPSARTINDKRARRLETELGLPDQALDVVERQAAIVDLHKAFLELESALHKVKPPTARAPRKRR